MFVRLLFTLALLCQATTLWAQQPSSRASEVEAVLKEKGLQAALDHYRELCKTPAANPILEEIQLSQLGQKLMQTNQAEQAQALFQLNAELNASSPLAHYLLAEALYNSDHYPKAKVAFDRAAELLPTSALPKGMQGRLQARIDQKRTMMAHFVSREKAGLFYGSWFGGGPAGNWDVDTLVAFSNQHKVSVHYAPHNLYDQPVPTNLDEPFVTETGLDVVSGFMGGIYRDRIAKGQLADLSALWAEQKWDQAFPELFRGMASFQGKPYFVPQAFQLNPIWYRKDIFAKLGLKPPKTWDQLLALCERLDEAGYVPITVGAADWSPPIARWFTILNLRLNGVAFHNQVLKGQVAFTDPRLREVFHYWAQLHQHKGMVPESANNTYGQAITEFAQGKAAMYNLGEWIFESLPEESWQHMDFFTVPVLREGVASAEIVHAYGAFQLSDASHGKQAQDLLRWLGSQEVQNHNAKTLNRTVARADASAAYDDVRKRLFALAANTKHGVPLLEFNTRPEMAQALLEAFKTFWKNPASVNELLQGLETTRKEVFK